MSRAQKELIAELEGVIAEVRRILGARESEGTLLAAERLIAAHDHARARYENASRGARETADRAYALEAIVGETERVLGAMNGEPLVDAAKRVRGRADGLGEIVDAVDVALGAHEGERLIDAARRVRAAADAAPTAEWAVVEIVGHGRLVGRISEMHMFGPTAIFSIRRVSEAEARAEVPTRREEQDDGIPF